MKNIQIIDAAVNCVYDIFAASGEEFANERAPAAQGGRPRFATPWKKPRRPCARSASS